MTKQPSFIVISLIIFFVLLVISPAAQAEDKSGVKPQVISFPSGPGSIEGLGESFEPNLNTGSAVYSVRISVPPGINGHTPDLSLQYNSGNGNSPFGRGWKLDIPYVQRQTDKGVPSYVDTVDTFIYSNGEELVPTNDGYYRFENESEFIRLNRINGYWEARQKDGTVILFGETSDAQIVNDFGTFSWYPSEKIDTNGSTISYSYIKDRGQIYLSEVRYGETGGSDYHAVIFTYEDRTDYFSDYRSRSQIITFKRCAAIEVYSSQNLVRRYSLEYKQNEIFSFLEKVALFGKDGTTELPALTFAYTEFNPEINKKIVSMTSPPPYTLKDINMEVVDINGDSLPDMVYTPDNDYHKYYVNKGRGEWESSGPVIPVGSPGNQLEVNGVQIADINGDGLSDFLIKTGTTSLEQFFYLKGTTSIGWNVSDLEYFNVNPAFTFEDPNTRLVDINNDGLIDIMRTTRNGYLYWLSQKGNRWNAAADFTSPPLTAPFALTFEHPSVHLADMNGDRMQDMVTFYSPVHLVYFPNMGNGVFGDPVIMNNWPYDFGVFDKYFLFDDINADGLADVIFVQNTGLRYWLNTGNDSLEGPIFLYDTPEHSYADPLRIADMNGNGSRDILYHKYPADYAEELYQYLDFSGDERPYLLKSIDNGMGKIITIDYRSSTSYYLEARDNGNPWERTSPFPVTVVGKTTVHDNNSGDDYITEYLYRNPHYDGIEREFRGFDYVEKKETGDLTAPAMITKHTFDTGITEESMKNKILQIDRTAENGDCQANITGCYISEILSYTTRNLLAGTDGKDVKISFNSGKKTYLYENTDTPRILETEYDIDNYGNRINEFSYGEISEIDRGHGNDELLTYTEYAVNTAAWIADKPAHIYKTDYAGIKIAEEWRYYDGQAFTGLPLYQVNKGNMTRKEEALGPNGNNAVIQSVRNEYDTFGNIISIKDPLGNTRDIIYDTQFNTYPEQEIIYLENDKTLSLSAAYDPGFGVMTSSVDFNGSITEYIYDPLGRMEKLIKPGDSPTYPTETYTYTLSDPVSSIMTEKREEPGKPGTLDSITYFDGLGRKLQTKEEGDESGFVLKDGQTFNQRLQIKEKYNPYFTNTMDYEALSMPEDKTTLEYDPVGRVTKQINPDNTFIKTEYLPLEEVKYDEEDTNAASSHYNTPHIYTYNGLKQLTAVYEPNEGAAYITSYKYTPTGYLTEITDAQNNIKTMEYDWPGRKTFMDDPDRGIMTYLYDDAGNLKETSDAKGQAIKYDYDMANRIRTENYIYTPDDAAPEITYHYDDDLSPVHSDAENTEGLLAYVEDQAGAEYYSYTARGLLKGKIKETDGTGYVSLFGYDAMDRITYQTYPDNMQIEYTYNSMGLLESASGFIEKADYKPSGRPGKYLFSNRVSTDYTYDSRIRLNTLITKNTRSLATLQDLTYAYDGAGNVTLLQDGRTSIPSDKKADHIFQYDNLYRLKESAGSYGTINYAYNSIGNLTSKTSGINDPTVNIGTLEYGVNAGPRAVTRAGSIDYTYDLNGNLSTRDSSVFIHDHKDRMTNITKPDGTVINLTYDYKGIRAIKEVIQEGQAEKTVYIDRYTEIRGGKLIKYIFAGSRRIARVTANYNPGNLIQGFNGSENIKDTGLDKNNNGIITIEEITSGGSDPDTIEAIELSEALNIYYQNIDNAASPISLTTITQAIKEYKTGAVDANIYFYHPNHLGSGNIITDYDGNAVEQTEHYPFGKDRYSDGTFRSEYRFTDKELDDETGLYYYEARYYDPMAGRFVEVDPVDMPDPAIAAMPVDPGSGGLYGSLPYRLNRNTFSGSDTDDSDNDSPYRFTSMKFSKALNSYSYNGDGSVPPSFLANPQLLNTYSYVGNNPVNFVDPWGLETTIIINRGTSTNSSTPGTINVTATNTSSTFSGSTLEPSPTSGYNMIPTGTYSAYQRSQSSTGRTYDPNRIQLNNVPGMTGAQIHVGNIPRDTKGCVLAGTTAGPNRIGGSTNAMTSINNIINADGGPITIIVK